MEFIIRFMINLFDLGIFWYYFHCFKQMKKVPKGFFAAYLVIMAAVWAAASGLENPYLNLITLLFILLLTTFFFVSKMWLRIVNIAIFVGTGILFEPIGLLLLQAANYTAREDGVYKYYFVAALCSFIRGNVLYLLSKLISKREVRLSKIPKEIIAVLVMVFVFAVLNCCFIIILSLESGNPKSLIMCISLLVSIVLTYYFMLYMMERFNYLMHRQYEDEMYREEMFYKEIYYSEVEKRNECVQNLKHDLKNKLSELYHLAEKGDSKALAEQMGDLCQELGQIDERIYTDNPIVDSVLRIKFGLAKSEGIEIDTAIRIPKQMQLERGDVGVLYGNLLDNAIEACRKVPEGKRFIRLENKYQSGKLLLVITNSKTMEKNESLKTTKQDSYSHGRGILSVQRVADKYNGTAGFTDKGEVFEASVMLYGIEVKK